MLKNREIILRVIKNIFIIKFSETLLGFVFRTFWCIVKDFLTNTRCEESSDKHRYQISFSADCRISPRVSKFLPRDIYWPVIKSDICRSQCAGRCFAAGSINCQRPLNYYSFSQPSTRRFAISSKKRRWMKTYRWRNFSKTKKKKNIL